MEFEKSGRNPIRLTRHISSSKDFKRSGSSGLSSEGGMHYAGKAHHVPRLRGTHRSKNLFVRVTKGLFPGGATRTALRAYRRSDSALRAQKENHPQGVVFFLEASPGRRCAPIVRSDSALRVQKKTTRKGWLFFGGATRNRTGE